MVEEAEVKQQHEKHDTENDFLLVNSSDEEKEKIMQAALKAKDDKIRELETSL